MMKTLGQLLFWFPLCMIHIMRWVHDHVGWLLQLSERILTSLAGQDPCEDCIRLKAEVTYLTVENKTLLSEIKALQRKGPLGISSSLSSIRFPVSPGGTMHSEPSGLPSRTSSLPTMNAEVSSVKAEEFRDTFNETPTTAHDDSEPPNTE